LPAGERARVTHRELAWTYRQFGQVIGVRTMREAVIRDRVRPDRVVSAFSGDMLLGYLALRLDGTGPFDLGVPDFRRHFGAVESVARFGALRVLERREKPDEIFIDGFLVRPEARGGGIGAKLLEVGERIGRERGKSVFRVRVRADNTKAAAFYRRQGFVNEGASEISPLARLFRQGPVFSYAKRL
jgi:ribosomal protein S18 acetylase RimI-like enzyme